MSYGLFLFRAVEGEDPRTTFLRGADEEEAAAVMDLMGPAPPWPDHVHAENHRLAAALREAFPEFEVFEGAQGLRVLELTSQEDGIQVSFFEKSAAITMPYWHSGSGAGPVFARVRRVLEIMERNGWKAFDPQMDKVLDLRADFPAATASYRRTADHLPEIIASAQQPGRERKPWWKFW